MVGPMGPMGEIEISVAGIFSPLSPDSSLGPVPSPLAVAEATRRTYKIRVADSSRSVQPRAAAEVGK